ncbi:DUF3781 domain-containing protein [Muribaculum intestinale]|uniref:DUF3781 domain-containing protein n=1 Tax=Muribaculum intestinale TaxID=1796646 RepID=A0A4S2FMY5_9BACT|nr:DUF3781 domain-containing protein [Muribaculum intestinale]MYM13497.1 DUF3781 domain-containing protein [Muribaculum intestinale]TGY70348.1 DUF3781 domain-containing protein [Muribaculum intestinale]
MIDATKLHTTPLGEERIRRNLELQGGDILNICRCWVLDDNAVITRKGKNWYVEVGHVRLTINANSNTIITAHKI